MQTLGVRSVSKRICHYSDSWVRNALCCITYFSIYQCSAHSEFQCCPITHTRVCTQNLWHLCFLKYDCFLSNVSVCRVQFYAGTNFVLSLIWLFLMWTGLLIDRAVDFGFSWIAHSQNLDNFSYMSELSDTKNGGSSWFLDLWFSYL
jgi:hypothetical protein